MSDNTQDSSPIKLELVSPEQLRIEWSSGEIRTYAVSELRSKCPCATCREKRKAADKPAELLPVLTPEETQPDRIVGMRPVGNYAYGIEFADGHDTGIFSLEFLRELGEVQN